MYLGGTYLGLATFTNGIDEIIPKSYSKVEFFGNGVYSKLWIRTGGITDAEFNALTPDTYIPTWDSRTKLLSPFINNTNGGNVIEVDTPITHYNVQRRDESEAILTEIGSVDIDSELKIMDYKSQKGKTYKYYVTPITDTEIGEQLVTSSITIDYDGWFLIDEINNRVFRFLLNEKPGAVSSKTNLHITEVANKFPIYQQDETNYIEGSISAIIGEITDEGRLHQTIDDLKLLQDTINNGEEKILKNMKGQIWKVMTNNYIENAFVESHIDCPYEISFSFHESGEV